MNLTAKISEPNIGLDYTQQEVEIIINDVNL